jgi:hypothetical protein
MMQVLPWQQPFGHESGLHVCCWQEPPAHTLFWLVQSEHVPPKTPHAEFPSPGMQTSPAQQPKQLLALHLPAAGTHAPLLGSQTEFGGQDVHCLPEAPQAAGVVVVTH